MKPMGSWGRIGRHLHNTVPLTSRSEMPSTLSSTPRPGLAYGMGRSYGDVCLNPGGSLWETRYLDRFIAFDEETGELTCEAGVLLGDIQRTFMPRGWTLAVTPGTQFVTVGGAIANDVHGKNHHARGTFGHHVTGLALARTDGEMIECGPHIRPEWFRATVAGLGLTGVIVQATLRLIRVPGPWLETETVAFSGLDEFFAIADESDGSWEHTVAWFDCLAKQPRGVFHRARPSHENGKHEESPTRATVPVEPPMSLVNTWTLRAFNLAYLALEKAKPRRRLQHHSRFLYPLDNLLQWNRMYGPKGFFQYQAVLPHAARIAATGDMLEEIRRSGEGSFLAVLKTFGTEPPAGMLSFPMHGVTVALDFRNEGEKTLRLFERLDDIVANAGGRIYLAKDARAPRSLFERGYPQRAGFMAFRDPGISSAMSRRMMGS